jgi:tRNA-dihydrouridine synthase 4
MVLGYSDIDSMTAAAGPSTITSTYITKQTTTTKFQNESESERQDPEREKESDLFQDLPEAIRLSPSELLTQYQSPINVLAPLVRCSKLPFRHLCSLYETHITHTPMILAQEFSRAQVARVSDFSSSKNERGVFWMEPKSGTGTSTGTGTGTGIQSGNGTGDEDTGVVGRDRQDVERRADFGSVDGESSRVCTSPKTSRPTPTSHSPRNNRLPHTPQPPTPHSQLISGQLIAQLASPNSASLADASELISPYVDGVDINCGCPQKWAYHEGIGCALLRKPELVGDMVRVTKDRLGWGYPVSIKIRIDPEES